MEPLIKQLFKEKYQSIIQLCKDEESKKLILKNAGKYLESSQNIILGHELDQLCLLLQKAQFADSLDEVFFVAKMLSDTFKEINILPSLANDRGMTFSSKCLVSLAFFKPFMMEKTRRYAAPKPDYYRKISQVYLSEIGYPNIANHHKSWELQIGEFLG